MRKVIFYLIESESPQTEQSPSEACLSHEQIAIKQIVLAWQERQRVLVACQSQLQAEKIDEALWQLDTEHFVPHNLVGEGPRGGSPVELCWPEKRSSGVRGLLINLQTAIPDYAAAYNSIIDFVPFDPTLKALARERYLSYKNLGFNLKTIPISG